MYYYQFNIGDYLKSTQHLSPIEDLAYRRLLDRYYDTEKPLETDIKKLCRFIRLKDHETETQLVLEEFFFLTKNGWVQKRAQKEIQSYSAKADTARANGKKGGRPKKTQSVSHRNPEETGSKAKQETITNNHKPITILESAQQNPAENTLLAIADAKAPAAKKNKGSRLPDDFKLPMEWGNWALDNTNLTAEQIRFEGDKFGDYWRSQSGSKGVKADWLATWRNWCRRANEPLSVAFIDYEQKKRDVRRDYLQRRFDPNADF